MEDTGFRLDLRDRYGKYLYLLQVLHTISVSNNTTVKCRSKRQSFALSQIEWKGSTGGILGWKLFRHQSPSWSW
jgi:hypothetical protein